MRKCLALLLLLAASAFGQQPQTQNDPLFYVNAAYANGVVPGYWPTKGAGLVLNLSAGTSYCNGAIVTYAGSTLTLTGSTTNYVYLDTASSCAPGFNNTGFNGTSTIPIAVVVTGVSSITTITDDRTLFSSQGPFTRVCQIYFGDQSGPPLITGNIQPQGSLCYIPANAILKQVVLMVDSGASTVEVGYRHNGGTAILASTLTPAAVTGITDPIACANLAGTAITIEGNSVTCSTLTNSTLTAGDYIETLAGTADGTSNRMSIAVTWTTPIQ